MISIHAPRMGSDHTETHGDQHHRRISIHAPRMGSDSRRPGRRSGPCPDFNPRSPDGERLATKDEYIEKYKFQSTLPGWGATFIYCANIVYIKISIHAPRMGSDMRALLDSPSTKDFNPRSPDGERLNAPVTAGLMRLFQSTLPGWGATTCGFGDRRSTDYFNPRSPDGERPCRRWSGSRAR